MYNPINIKTFICGIYDIEANLPNASLQFSNIYNKGIPIRYLAGKAYEYADVKVGGLKLTYILTTTYTFGFISL